MSLYTKYRPRDWDSVIWQDAISTILRTSLSTNRVGHAYILTGSRGTGKTTTARILAKWVNCTDLKNGNPCHECTNCVAFDNGTMLDVIEIDGASNNGVDNVRDLIDKARFEPNQGKYKIYIIDEVHMLSTGAFNALLKTLEEPPSHVKFILATTEIEKVPETIRSRSLRFDFRKIEVDDIVKRLQYVCKEENIKTDTEALSLIARAARGALRDALTLLEQNTINSEVSTEYVRSTLSLIEDTLIDTLIDTMLRGDSEKMVELLDTLRGRHIDVRGFFDQIMYALRDRMLTLFRDKNGDMSTFSSYNEIFQIFEDMYAKMRIIPDGQLVIEMVLMRTVKRDVMSDEWTKDSSKTPTSNNTSSSKQEAIKNDSVVSKKETTPILEEKIQLKEEEWQKSIPSSLLSEEESEVNSPVTNQQDSQPAHQQTNSPANQPFSYIKLLEVIKGEKPALVTDLKTARFEQDETQLTLIFAKKWNYDRVEVSSIKNLIAECLQKAFGWEWNIECKLNEWTHKSLELDEVF